LFECQHVVEFAQDHLGYSRVKLSLDFFLFDNHNKDFSKDSALGETESNTLPKVIRTAKRDN
jgi:hypothetical protein